MTEVKDKDVKSWALNFIKDIESGKKHLGDGLTKEEMSGLLYEAVKIVKRLLGVIKNLEETL